MRPAAAACSLHGRRTRLGRCSAQEPLCRRPGLPSNAPRARAATLRCAPAGQRLRPALPRPQLQPLPALLPGPHRACHHAVHVTQVGRLPVGGRGQAGGAAWSGPPPRPPEPPTPATHTTPYPRTRPLPSPPPDALQRMPGSPGRPLQPPPTPPTHPPPHPAQVRLWDLRVNGCQALLQAPGLPTTAFDEQGLVFAVGAERGVVKLYDARNWAMGPFTSFPVRRRRVRTARAAAAAVPCANGGPYLVACNRAMPELTLPSAPTHPPLVRCKTRSTRAPSLPASSFRWTARCCWRWRRGASTCWTRSTAA